jgi:hypothetical protein
METFSNVKRTSLFRHLTNTSIIHFLAYKHYTRMITYAMPVRSTNTRLGWNHLPAGRLTYKGKSFIAPNSLSSRRLPPPPTVFLRSDNSDEGNKNYGNIFLSKKGRVNSANEEILQKSWGFRAHSHKTLLVRNLRMFVSRLECLFVHGKPSHLSLTFSSKHTAPFRRFTLR